MFRASVVLVCLAAVASAMYLPGVAPTEYFFKDKIDMKVNKITSVQTQIPYDYYSLPFDASCMPPSLKSEHENLGELLTGDKIIKSPYEIFMRVDEVCKPLCQQKLTATQAAKFSERIEQDYRVHWIIDGMPGAFQTLVVMEDNSQKTIYEDGFPLGFIGDAQQLVGTETGAAYIYNHVLLKLLYHSEESYSGNRIVGFEVTPVSVKHSWLIEDTLPSTCNDLTSQLFMKVEDGAALVFTYGVKWEQSAIKWSSRWDVYLQMTDSEIHWFSISNSLIIVLFLTGMVAMIMMRTLNRDFRIYNQLETAEEVQEETGWKLVHADVFRPPANPMALSVLVGSGVQVAMMTMITLGFALMGFLSPANRGGLLTALVVLYIFMGVFAGYFSSRLYKLFQGRSWKKNTVYTAIALPGIVFGIFFFLNFFIMGERSSGAVKFSILVALVAMWFGVSVPLTFLGAYFGYKKQVTEPPVHTNQIPRSIPEQIWYMKPVVAVLMGGLLPFGAVFIELFFILSSIWLHQFYYIFGFLFLVFVILALTCAEITIVMCYFQICSEDYHWWWRSFLTAGASSFYMFVYAVFYFFNKLHITKFVSALVYFGYTLILSLCFFCMTGAIGFYACLWFMRKIYSSIKVA